MMMRSRLESNKIIALVVFSTLFIFTQTSTATHSNAWQYLSNPILEEATTSNTSNWHTFTATTTRVLLQLSPKADKKGLFLIYSDHGVAAKGAIFVANQNYLLPTEPGLTYHIGYIDGDAAVVSINLIAAGETQTIQLQKRQAQEKVRAKDEIIKEAIAANTTSMQRLLNGSDCVAATTLCNSTGVAYNPTGAGENDFAVGSNNDGCLSGENLSAWYYFQFNAATPPGSSIEFTITPDGGDDYDFAVWGPGVDCNNLGSPIRCSYSSAGLTGLMDGSGDNSEGPAGNGFVEDIIVNPGDGFYLMIDNFSTSFTGFSLSWGGSASPYLDCSAVPPDAGCAMQADAGIDDAACPGDILFLNGTASFFTGIISYQWNATPAFVQPFIQNPDQQMTLVTLPPDVEDQVTFTLTVTQNVDGCVATANIVYEITPPDPVALEEFPDVCETEAEEIDLFAVQDGVIGQWSGDGVENNSFNPDGLTGAIELTFTPNPNQCAGIATTTINIISASQPDLEPVEDICGAADPVPLSTTQGGVDGEWSGMGVENNTFNPDGQTGSVTLTFTPNSDCASANTLSVNIEAPAVPLLDVFDPLCAEAASIDLPTIQDGFEGNWSGDGVSENTFDPFGLDNQDVILTFTPNPGQCATESTTSISVTEPTFPVLDVFDPLCQGDNPAPLPNIQDGISGSWTGSGVENSTFNPAGQLGEIELTFIPDDGQCAVLATALIEVTEGEAPVLDPIAALCESAEAINLPTLQDGVNGNWSGEGVTNNTFSPEGLNNSVELTFTPEGTECAIAATTTVVVNAPTTPNLDNFDALCESDETMTLPTTQDGITGNWSGDGVFDNEFNPLGQDGTITLEFIPDDGQCAVAANTAIEVQQAPTAEFSTNSLNTCNVAAQGSIVDLQGLIIDGNTTGIWSSNNASGVGLNNPSAVDFDGVDAPGTYTFTYITSGSDGTCPESSYDVDVFVEDCSCPSVATNSAGDLCNSDAVLDLSTLEGTDEEGTWSITSMPTGDTPATLDGTTFDATNADAGTYEVSFTLTEPMDNCPSTSVEQIVVNNADAPTLNEFSEMCESDAALALPTSQDGMTGMWSGQGVDAENMFSPSGLADNVVLTFTPDESFCASPASTSIVVTPPGMPELEPINELCELDDPISLPVTQDGIIGEWSGNGVASNQFDPDGLAGPIELTFTPVEGSCAVANTLIVSVAFEIAPSLDELTSICNTDQPLSLPNVQNGIQGEWTGQNVNNNEFNPTGLDGDIELTFNPTNNNCAVAVSTTIAVTAATEPALEVLPELCELDEPFSLPTTQDGVPGNWEGQNVTDNQFDPQGLEGETALTFVPLNGNCALTTSGMITVIPPAEPALDMLPDLCEMDEPFSLPTTQDGFAGTWEGQNVTDNQFDPQGLEGEIMLTFVPENGACAVENTTPATVTLMPFAVFSTTAAAACSETVENSIVDLMAMIADGDTGGSWEDTDNTGVNLNDPSAIDFTDIPEGIYTFTYTTNVTSPCPNVSYPVEITVESCAIDCPSAATNPPSSDLCNSGDNLNLSDLVVTTETGTWSITSAPNGTNPAILNGTLFDASSADAGSYEITFTLSEAPDGCPDASTQIIEVEAAPYAVFATTSSSTCNASADGSVIDLTEMIVEGNMTGTWMDDNGVGVDLSTPSSVDFNGVTPGETYTFTYTTNSGATVCPEQSYTVSVFVEDCACPSVALSTTNPLCNGGESIDLSSLENTEEAGTWSIISTPTGSTPALLSGTLFDPTSADAGMYELQFLLNEEPDDPTCPASNTITIQVDAAVSAGIANAPTDFCDNENFSLVLVNEITDEDMGGQWLETSAIPSQGNAFSATNGTFNPNGQIAGTYTFLYQIGDANSACPMDEVAVAVVVNATPIADAGSSQQLDCLSDFVTLDGSASTGTSFEWTDSNGNVMGTNSELNVMEAGNYTLTVSSNAGCSAIDMVVVEPEAEALLLAVSTSNPACDETTGDILINSAVGGTPPYHFSLNGELQEELSTFIDLEPGDYTLSMQDNIGCQTDTTITILAPENLDIQLLVENQNLFWNDSTQIIIATDTELGQNHSIEWSHPEILHCATCPSTIVVPVETTTLTATVIDENGCSATDDITLFVDKRPQIYPPNAFAPEGEAVNTMFMIYTGKGVASFDSFNIFDRWGNVVFENYDLPLNDSSMGWDGTHKGQSVNSSVFVWVAEFTLLDGTKEMRRGEVTVIR